jgi:hypothetical protein
MWKCRGRNKLLMKGFSSYSRTWIQTLKGKREVMKHMLGEQDSESKKKMDELTEELKEKVAESEDLEALNKTLVI